MTTATAPSRLHRVPGHAPSEQAARLRVGPYLEALTGPYTVWVLSPDCQTIYTK